MREFDYRALRQSGETVSGQISAADEHGALAALAREGLVALELRPVRARRLRTGRETALDRLMLLREIGTLLIAGVPLAEALADLEVGYATSPLGAPLGVVRQQVSGGSTFSAALREAGFVVPTYAWALLEAGEARGELGPALQTAAAQLNQERLVAQEVKQALVYPLVLIGAGVVAVLVVFLAVVPRFAPLVAGARFLELPAISRWVITTGVFLKANLLAATLALGGVCVLLAGVWAQPAVRQRLFRVAARIPLVGTWIVESDVGRWATLCSALLKSRIPLVQALELSASACRLEQLRDSVRAAASGLAKGETLAGVLAKQGWLPPQRVNLVRVGERSGTLPEMLSTLGELETEAATVRLRRLLTLIEPIAILLIGGVIGGVMIALILAITGVNTMRL